MYPHERSLVKRLEGEPFVLLGVNSDEEKTTFKEAMERENITWRNWWDGATSSPIARAWNVHAWPTIYVLDHRGVIRYKGVRDLDLDEAIDRLLRELSR